MSAPLWLQRIALVPLARLLDRSPRRCWADLATGLGLGWDVGHGLESCNGPACAKDAGGNGMCWCGKFVCLERLAERGMDDTLPRYTFEVTKEGEAQKRARKVIEHFERDPDATCVHGRVLAHGGKR